MKLPKPEGSHKADLRVSKKEQFYLMWVLQDNPLRGHGLGGSTLYYYLCKLRKKGLVRRLGYRYYPTVYAHLWLSIMKEKSRIRQTKIQESFKTKQKVEWRDLFN